MKESEIRSSFINLDFSKKAQFIEEYFKRYASIRRNILLAAQSSIFLFSLRSEWASFAHSNIGTRVSLAS